MIKGIRKITDPSRTKEGDRSLGQKRGVPIMGLFARSDNKDEETRPSCKRYQSRQRYNFTESQLCLLSISDHQVQFTSGIQ